MVRRHLDQHDPDPVRVGDPQLDEAPRLQPRFPQDAHPQSGQPRLLCPDVAYLQPDLAVVSEAGPAACPDTSRNPWPRKKTTPGIVGRAELPVDGELEHVPVEMPAPHRIPSGARGSGWTGPPCGTPRARAGPFRGRIPGDRADRVEGSVRPAVRAAGTERGTRGRQRVRGNQGHGRTCGRDECDSRARTLSGVGEIGPARGRDRALPGRPPAHRTVLGGQLRDFRRVRPRLRVGRRPPVHVATCAGQAAKPSGRRVHAGFAGRGDRRPVRPRRSGCGCRCPVPCAGSVSSTSWGSRCATSSTGSRAELARRARPVASPTGRGHSGPDVLPAAMRRHLRRTPKQRCSILPSGRAGGEDGAGPAAVDLGLRRAS